MRSKCQFQRQYKFRFRFLSTKLWMLLLGVKRVIFATTWMTLSIAIVNLIKRFTLKLLKRTLKNRLKSRIIQFLQISNNSHNPHKLNLLTVIFLRRIISNFLSILMHKLNLLFQILIDQTLKDQNLILSTNINSKLKLFL